MTPRAAALVAGLLLPGCAVFSCTPATIVVAEMEQQDRLGTRVESLRVDPFGRVQEVRRDVVEHSYWVRATDGEWIAVYEATWRRAEKGKPLDVCR